MCGELSLNKTSVTNGVGMVRECTREGYLLNISVLLGTFFCMFRIFLKR